MMELLDEKEQSISNLHVNKKEEILQNEKLIEIQGIIRINPRCYTDAFVEDPDGGPDIYIEGNKSRGVALEGDLVLVRMHPSDKWKKNPMRANVMQKTGFVVKIIKRNHPGIVGGFIKKYSPTHALFSPTDSRVPRMLIDIAECPLDFATQPDRYKDVLFIAQLVDWKESNNFAQGNLVKIVGESNLIESRMQIILCENQIYDQDFLPESYEELEYLNKLPNYWFELNSKGRRDLTNECTFTIDPKTARDLDDALSIKQVAEQIYEIGVHIADVSYFVKEMTSVDHEARLRTTSVYLVDRVIPMLPRPLCEHMCSLNPGEPKLTFSVIWKMDKYGRIIDEWFGRTIIKSCVKLAYEQAQDLINHKDDVSWIEEGSNMPKLHAFDWTRISRSTVLLNKIAQNMRAKRFQDGALKIDNVKIKYELDKESGLPTGFSFEQRFESNFLIEEFMLQANMAVAKKIYKYNEDHAFLRRHPPSHPDVLKSVKEFCEAKGYPMDTTSAGSIQKSVNSIVDPITSKVVSHLLLRSMKNAEYVCTGSMTCDELGFSHYALNVSHYTHFTSPIRRYADIIVHRQLAIALGLSKDSNEDVKTLSMMAAECTKRKISSKLISETSQRLYFNLFVQRAGFCELLACVTKIHDQSFEVILVDYNQSGRVYLDRLKKQIHNFKIDNSDGISKLILDWKPLSKKSVRNVEKQRKRIEMVVATRDSEHKSCRNDLERRRNQSSMHKNMKINEAFDDKQQIIQVFDVIRVIVTVDEKDISKLKIDLKTPSLHRVESQLDQDTQITQQSI